MFTSFEKNDCESDCITFRDNSQGQALVSVKFLSQPNVQFLKFFLLNRWTIICYLYCSFVRWVTIICAPIKVRPSLGEVVVPLPLKVS
jgi:hypothetical protein